MAPKKSGTKKSSGSKKKKSAARHATAKKSTRAVIGAGAAKAIDAYVEQRNPGLKEVIAAVRRLVKKTVPAAAEAVNPWGVPVFEVNGTLCFLMAGKQHVTLGFVQGTSLPDPAGLLEGTGKNLRHVKLKTADQVSNPHLENLIIEAAVVNAKTANAGKRRPVKQRYSVEPRRRVRC
jgi:hypothetical protein